MKKQKKLSKKLIFMLTIISLILLSNNVFAFNVNGLVKEMEYSDEYKQWLELDEETKEKSIMPRKYKINSSGNMTYNPLKSAKLLASTVSEKFSLKDTISQNMIIKNQGNTGSCWTFSGIASLETNLALKDYYNNNVSKIYDFSERHLEYATTKKFLNGEINENGFERDVGKGGSSILTKAYLTNGIGAIDENEMPYLDTNELIDISEIQNKNVTSQVYDITDFPTKTSSNFEQLKLQMKEHIKNYGGIDAGTHEGTDCLNTETGALYCNNAYSHVMNHAILLVGWDDNYDKNNFNEKSRPTNNGAWIAKDSHGTNEDNRYSYEEIKKLLFENNKSNFENQGITSYDQITDELVESWATSNNLETKNGYVYIKHNDDGYLYISYEDVNVYTGLTGITNAENSVSYDNIYQYNVLGSNYDMTYGASKLYLANIFNKKTQGEEYLTQVSISTPNTVTCKVYVNPNGNSKNKTDLQQVQLKQGESQTIDAGYHTLEFANPIKLEGSEYVVAIELQGKSNSVDISIECDYPDFYEKKHGTKLPSSYVVSGYSGVKIENGKCFYTTEENFETNQWNDLSNLYNDSNKQVPSGDSTIKAFTVSSVDENAIKEIKITTPPTKTEYDEGENFDKTGMTVKAIYGNETEKEITDYTIQNGEDLKANQTSVTISYEGKTVMQSITVKAKEQPNQPDEPESLPVSSNFDNAKLNVNSVKYYTYTDKNKKEYFLINVSINNIERNNVNEGYTYYYYLSTNKEESNIENWVEVKNEKVENNVLSFDINSKDVSNYKDLLENENLYLYIKEVATRGTNSVEFETNSMEITNEPELEVYVDDVKKDFNNGNDNGGNNDNSNSGNNNQNDNGSNNNNSSVNNNNISSIQGKTDQTQAGKLLPYTGIKGIIIALVIVFALGIIIFIRYKSISKYVK